MTFLSYTSGMKGFKFMQKPNNDIFHGVTAMFDEHMVPSCPDNISPGSTRIGANYRDTEFYIPLEDRGWFDEGAIPPSGLYPSAGGIPLQQGPFNLGPQQPLAGPLNPPVVPPRPPVRPTSAPQPSIQPPGSGSRRLDLDNDAFGHLSLHGFTIPPGHGLTWEQQLHDMLRACYQPAQQATSAKLNFTF